MPYIKREKKEVVSEVLTCSHPQVKRIWQWGGGSADHNAIFVDYTSLMMEDDTRHDFQSDNDKSGIEKAEEFLSSLS